MTRAMSDYRVVVGVDMSDDAAAALDWAADEAATRRGELVIVHAFEPHPMGADAQGAEGAQLLAKVRDAARQDIEDRIERVLAVQARLRVRRHYVVDLPARALATLAASADLLVIGAHGDRLTDRSRLGSTPRTCLQSPMCPVVVISARHGVDTWSRMVPA